MTGSGVECDKCAATTYGLWGEKAAEAWNTRFQEETPETSLSLKSTTFASLRTQFEKTLHNLLVKMEAREEHEGELSLKVKVTLIRTIVMENGEQRPRTEPAFSYVVQSTVQDKEKRKGRTKEGCELLWDEAKSTFKIQSITDGQTSLFEEG